MGNNQRGEQGQVNDVQAAAVDAKDYKNVSPSSHLS